MTIILSSNCQLVMIATYYVQSNLSSKIATFFVSLNDDDSTFGLFDAIFLHYTYTVIYHYGSSGTVTVNRMVNHALSDVDSCMNVICCYYHVYRDQLTNHSEKYFSHSVISRKFIDILALF